MCLVAHIKVGVSGLFSIRIAQISAKTLHWGQVLAEVARNSHLQS